MEVHDSERLELTIELRTIGRESRTGHLDGSRPYAHSKDEAQGLYRKRTLLIIES